MIHFVSHLSNKVLFYGTVKVYLAAVKKTLYTEFDFPLDFTSMPLLYKTLRGIKCLQSVSKLAHYPIIVMVLQQIYSKLQTSHSQNVASTMLWAAFTRAFFCFFFEAANSLTMASFTLVLTYPEQILVLNVIFSVRMIFLEITIKSKTDPFCETVKLTTARSNSNVCAVSARQDYLLQTH